MRPRSHRTSAAARFGSLALLAVLRPLGGPLHAQPSVASVPADGGRTLVGVLLVLGGAALVLVVAREVRAMRERMSRVAGEAARAEARRAEARFRALVQHSSDVVLVVDDAACVRFASPAVQRVLGHTPEAIHGRSLTELVHPDDIAGFEAALRRTVRPAADATDASVITSVRLRRMDDSWRHVESVSTDLRDDPAIGGLVLNVRDVTERAVLEERLAHQAFHDPLTGLANRALLRERVERALVRASRDGGAAAGRGTAVLFVDLDDFRTINDTLGHGAGDRLLCTVSARLLNATRGVDTVARLGGDEFAVLLAEVRDARDAVRVAERVLQALARPCALDAREVQVGGSVGIACAGDDDGVEELLRNADLAMYAAKRRGRGTYEIFAPALHAAARERMELAADLRHALDVGLFRLLYQPIVTLPGGVAYGVEALVRWQHPTRGLVPPLDFIPLAEETGLIVPIGRWVLGEACRQTAAWHAAGVGDALSVTVNVSGRQLADDALVGDVRDAIARTGLRPECLVLEITESVLMADAVATLDRLQRLKALGVRLAIDDFGTGYSSLSYLQRFPVDVIKIDRSFLAGVRSSGGVLAGTEHDANPAAVAEAVLALGHTLGLRTVAVGVETDVQRRWLEARECALAQGFHFARPLTAAAAEAYLRSAQPVGTRVG